MSSFLKTALKSFRTSGTLHPSSQWLIEKLLHNIDFGRDLTIVEFGTGDGVITEVIADRMSADSQLIALEINEDFYKMTAEKLRSYPQVQVLQRSAFEIGDLLNELHIYEVDYFISSLPLSLFSEDKTAPFLETCYSLLVPGQSYAQYQYTLGKYKLLRQIFDKVSLDFTFRNLPPAFIYTCIKSESQVAD